MKTSYAYNSNGLVITRVENDDDYVATNTNPSAARITYYKYDNSSFPGRVTEIRILSELKPGGTCNASTTTDCKRTIYTYTSDGQLDTIQEIGFTYTSAGAVTSYNFTTDHAYDSKGRLTDVFGPRSGVADDVQYTYYASGNGLSTDYLNQVKRKKNATDYVTTTYAEYEWWGNAGRIDDPNSKSICRAFHASYGLVSSQRVVVNGTHGNCSGSAGSNDETTYFTYDTHRRLTKTQQPRNTCVVRTYDSEGRFSTVQEQETISLVCDENGDKMVHTYDDEGLLIKTEWQTSAAAVERRQEYTYRTDRRREKTINPVSTSHHKKWLYDDDGVPSELQFEDYATSDARTQWDVDNFNRSTAIRRYTTATSNEAFTITPGVQLELPTRVRDPASHDLDLVWDDLNRKVKQVTPESGTDYFVYDEAGNLTTHVKSSGTADTVTDTFTYDNMSRRLTWDTGDAKCFTLGGAELQYTYDALPSGISCPNGSTCDLLQGRLAYVKVKVYCDDAKADDTFDQETFYSYSEPGRTKEHTVQDDGGRVGRVTYTFDKNGNPTRIDYPAGSSSGAVYTYGGGGDGDSNANRAKTIQRDTTTVLDQIKWNSFGPVAEYRQENTFFHSPSNYKVKQTFTRNLAYRTTEIYARSVYTTPDNVFKIAFTEDVRGRYTARDFSYGSNGQADMFFLYDDLSRLTCRTTTSQATCPTSGSSPLENMTYNTSSDRSSIILANNVLTNDTYTTTFVTGTDKINYITRAGGSYQINFTWDTRGNRLTDDDTQWSGTSDDKRTYTYDARNNLITVTGRYWYATNDMNPYTLTNAYDERNRRIFKSFKDTDLNKEAQWFFYYDQFDRLIQAKHTPDISDSNTYSIYQWYWLGDLPFLYYQIDYPAATTTRRYLHTDEQGRPHAAWSWPSSGDTARVWEVEAGAFGWDVPVLGTSIHQPMRLPGQYHDSETEAVTLSGAGAELVKRPGLADNRHRVYDSFSGTYLRVDPLVRASWDSYSYAMQNPVEYVDPDGQLPFDREACERLMDEVLCFDSICACVKNTICGMLAACMNGDGNCYWETQRFLSCFGANDRETCEAMSEELGWSDEICDEAGSYLPLGHARKDPKHLLGPEVPLVPEGSSSFRLNPKLRRQESDRR